MSRELDAQVATEVMGCDVVWDVLDDKFSPYCYCKDEFGIVGRLHEQRDSHVPKLLAFYSTDIAPAMLVVEKMRQDDFWWAAAYKETLVEGIYQAGYSVTFRCVRAGSRGDRTATALTLSEAICRAALLAAEAEK